MTEKSYHRINNKNPNIENHHDLEVNHEKTIRQSFHNLKYWRKLNSKNNFNFD